jgi:hypothetical protein
MNSVVKSPMTSLASSPEYAISAHRTVMALTHAAAASFPLG